MIRRIVVLALVIGGAVMIEPLRVPTEGVIAPRSLFLFGILLLAADTLGDLMHGLRVPRIVGYLVAGLALGPSLLDLVPDSVVRDLTMTKQLAVGLIGLLAGAELRVADLRRRFRAILAILAFQALAVLATLIVAVLLGHRFIPFVADYGFGPALALAVVFATILTVNSPMVTIAELSETGAAGAVAKTTLGVVLLADVVIIVLFTLALGAARSVFEPGAAAGGGVLATLVQEVLGSLVAGVVLGALMSLYLRFVKRELVIFAVVVVFATVASALALHFEMLLSLVVAGFFVENVAPVKAEPLVRALHQTAWPVFVVFFALAGVELHVQEMGSVWPVIVGTVVLRAGAIAFGARTGAWLAGAEEPVRRYGWMGLVAQAGVALGLPVLVAQRIPSVGPSLHATVVGVIAVNQLLGPILFRLALAKAGELAPAVPATAEAQPSPAG